MGRKKCQGRWNKIIYVKLLICAWRIPNTQEVLITSVLNILIQWISSVHGRNSQCMYKSTQRSETNQVSQYLQGSSVILGSSPQTQVFWELTFACYSGTEFQPQYATLTFKNQCVQGLLFYLPMKVPNKSSRLHTCLSLIHGHKYTSILF